MIKFKINIDYKRKFKTDKERSDSLNDNELTQNYVDFAVGAKYKNGIDDGTKRRMYARIQRKFDEAIDNNEEYVSLEKSETDFIKDCMKDCPYPSNISKFVVVFEDEFEKAIKDAEEVGKEVQKEAGK